MMPELDGYGVLHLLSHDPNTAGIPFIFLTAKADKSDIRTGMNLGADDYLTKPFEGYDLLKVIETRLKKYNYRNGNNSERKPEVGNLFFSQAKELKEFRKLSDQRHVRNCRRKEFLYMEGQLLNDVYLINHGKLKTYKSGMDGKELVTGFHTDGDFLGYVPILEEAPCNETAVVVEDAEVTIIPRQDFLSLIYSSKDVAHKFIKLISNNLAEVENRLLNLAYQSVRQRVAGTLLSLKNNLSTSRNEQVIIPRKDIANIVGTATESLNRTLADFRDEGLIELDNKGIRFLDEPKLTRMTKI
jgi:CRP-like cAMP-binding protein